MTTTKNQEISKLFCLPYSKEIEEKKEMVFCPGFFPRKLEKKVFSNPKILISKDFMIDIPLLTGWDVLN